MTFLTTPRLIIRSFKEKDAGPLLNYLSSPRIPCFHDEKLNSLSDAKKDVIKRACDASQFAVVLKETNELIGHIFADNRGEPDNTWSIGWYFNQLYEGKGFATESVSALFNYLFTEKNARRLYAYVETYNHASHKLCECLYMGFRRRTPDKHQEVFVNIAQCLQDKGESVANTLKVDSDYDSRFVAMIKR